MDTTEIFSELAEDRNTESTDRTQSGVLDPKVHGSVHFNIYSDGRGRLVIYPPAAKRQVAIHRVPPTALGIINTCKCSHKRFGIEVEVRDVTGTEWQADFVSLTVWA